MVTTASCHLTTFMMCNCSSDIPSNECKTIFQPSIAGHLNIKLAPKWFSERIITQPSFIKEGNHHKIQREFKIVESLIPYIYLGEKVGMGKEAR